MMSSTFNYGTTVMASGQSTATLSNIWRQLAESKEFREEFSALQLKRGVAFQIRALLKKRGWTQGKLAENANLTQGVVSRAQSPEYGNLTINTINRLAAGFDVAFIGKFVPFSELVDWFQNLSEETGEVRTFEKENEELLKGRIATSRVHRRSRRKRMRQNLIMRTKRVGVSIVRGYDARGALPSGRMNQLQLPLMQGLGEPKVIPMTVPEKGVGPQLPCGLIPSGGGTKQWMRELRSNRL